MSATAAPPGASQAPPPTATTPPPAGNGERPVFAARITWAQLLALIGASWAVTAVLVGVIYKGVTDDVGDVKAEVRSLRGEFQAATVAGVSVKDLIARAPTLERQILETHDAALRNGDRLEALGRTQDGMVRQLDTLAQQGRETHDVVLRNGARLDALIARGGKPAPQ